MHSTALVYLRLGLHHIADLRGYDHILFIAALTIPYRSADWRRLLWLVTAFTAGHSTTLALATFDLVRLNARLVETAIAATILAASLFTLGSVLRSPDPEPRPETGERARYAMAVGFGLIHGLGFSTFLRSLLGDEDSLVLPLFSFNVGLEFGQLTIVVGVLALGWIVDRVLRQSRRSWVLISSGTVAGLGAGMLVQRLRG